jgi:hypothetical protein
MSSIFSEDQHIRCDPIPREPTHTYTVRDSDPHEGGAINDTSAPRWFAEFAQANGTVLVVSAPIGLPSEHAGKDGHENTHKVDKPGAGDPQKKQVTQKDTKISGLHAHGDADIKVCTDNNNSSASLPQDGEAKCEPPEFSFMYLGDSSDWDVLLDEDSNASGASPKAAIKGIYGHVMHVCACTF